MKIVAGDARGRRVFHGDDARARRGVDEDLATQRRLQRCPGNCCPIVPVAQPIEDDRRRLVRGDALAQGLHPSSAPELAIAFAGRQFRQLRVFAIEPMVGGGRGQRQQLQQADGVVAPRPALLLIGADVFLRGVLALRAQQHADQFGLRGLQFRLPRERIGDAQFGVIAGDIFQFAAPAARPDRQAPADLLEGVAATFLHADEPVGAAKVAVAVEVGHEVVKEWVVKGLDHAVEEIHYLLHAHRDQSIHPAS